MERSSTSVVIKKIQTKMVDTTAKLKNESGLVRVREMSTFLYYLWQ